MPVVKAFPYWPAHNGCQLIISLYYLVFRPSFKPNKINTPGLQSTNKYKYQKQVNNSSSDSEVYTKHKVGTFTDKAIISPTINSDQFKWNRKPDINSKPYDMNGKYRMKHRGVLERRNSGEKIVSKFNVIKKELITNPKSFSHRKVPSRTKWVKTVSNVSSTKNLKKCDQRFKKSCNDQHFNTETGILSKYKFVHGGMPDKKNKSVNKKFESAYVWKRRRSSSTTSNANRKSGLQRQNSASKQPKKLTADSRNTFIRKRYNIVRRTKLVQTRFKTVSITYNNNIMFKNIFILC